MTEPTVPLPATSASAEPEWPSAPEWANTAVPPDWSEQDEPPMMLPETLWEKIKADPQYAPEHVALEAVTRLGPQAQSWVEGMRRWQPRMPPDALAHLVVKRFVSRARWSGAAAGLAGLPGAVIDVGVLAWTQSCMVLHLAAVYGVDPKDPQRAVDLLVLQGVHKYTDGARAALEVAAGRRTVGSLIARGDQTLSQVFIQLGMKLARMAGIRVARRMFAKVVPGAAVVLGTWANSSATKELAWRAMGMYRPRAILPPPPQGPWQQGGTAAKG